MLNPESTPEYAHGPLSQKVTVLNQALEGSSIPYAFGGAIALAFHKEPRATFDIDLNIFLTTQEKYRVIDVISGLFPINNSDELIKEIDIRDQGSTYWDETRVDLFFADTEFHNSMAGRVSKVPYRGEQIPILSAEDLIICKTLFNRGKDWQDIDGVFRQNPSPLDTEYILGWLEKFLGEDDSRIFKMKTVINETKLNIGD